MFKVVIVRKFNGGSHVFDLSFNTWKDAQKLYEALLLSDDIISAHIKEREFTLDEILEHDPLGLLDD